MYKGYSTPSRVWTHLGGDLTAAQLLALPDLVEEAEAAIEGLTGRAWLPATPIVEVFRDVAADVVYVDRAPVASVASVTATYPRLGATAVALAPGTAYAIDLASGRVRIAGGYIGWDVVVTYTPAATVPVAVRRATTLLAGAWLRADGASPASPDGVKSFSVGGEVTVTYRDDATGGRVVPDDVLALLAPHRRVVLA